MKISKSQSHYLKIAFSIFAMTILFTMFSSVIAYAAGPTEIGGHDISGAITVYKSVAIFFEPLCAFGILTAFIVIVTSSNDKTISGAYNFIKTIIAAFFIFLMIPLIVYVLNAGPLSGASDPQVTGGSSIHDVFANKNS